MVILDDIEESSVLFFESVVDISVLYSCVDSVVIGPSRRER